MAEIIHKKINIYFIGIGGIGMSGIAEVLISLGYRVSGSDIASSGTTKRLAELGAQIYIEHKAKNVKDATIVVYSSAITSENPEMIYARENNIPIMRRAEMIAELMRLKQGLAIAGTHGKTTTTSMLATILLESDLDPTYIIGGIVKNLDGHAKIGKGEFLVVESDESDGSFLLFNPILSVITNIDYDHMDFYKTRENLIDAFLEFANKVPFYGCVSLNLHDENIRKIKNKIRRPQITFGIYEELQEEAKKDGTIDCNPNFDARNIIYGKFNISYDLFINNSKKATVKINLPGRHNVLNSLGAISMAVQLGLDIQQIVHAISKFEGTGRRCQLLYEKNDFEIIDDYGHHPTEIASTINAIRSARENKKIVVIFEPHRFTRTRDCWNDFFHCFNSADEIYLCPIYPASEKPIMGIDSARLATDINRVHPNLIISMESSADITNVVNKYKNDSVTILALGAGSIGKKIREVVSAL